MDTINQNKAKTELIVSMLIFGSVGIFVHYINLPSSMISVVRGALGFLVLLIYAFASGKKISLGAVRSNLLLLFVSGAFIGFNWIFLFESYRYTTVAVSTLCYYMAPVFFVVLSVIFLKEKISLKKIICVAVSLFGMVLISGVFKSDFSVKEIRGVLFALCAALLYSFVTLFNKKFSSITPNDKTVVQLFFAAAVILPYSLAKKELDFSGAGGLQLALLLIVGIVHTGFSYVLFFGSIKNLPAQTTAVLSYIDPITAVILSALILKERLDFATVAGAVLIIGASVFSEINIKRKSTGVKTDG